MRISDLHNNRIIPFDCDDPKLTSLFSFFLHKAPTIESASAMNVDPDRLANNWIEIIDSLNLQHYKFISDYCSIEDYLMINDLHNEAEINRKSKRFVCKYKGNSEKDYQCILRHLRNSIAHGNVFLMHAGNRKFIMFDDFNKSGKMSARILLSQTDLDKMKHGI